MIVTCDIECTHRGKPGGGTTPLPYYGNELVSIGYKVGDTPTVYFPVYHKEREVDNDALGAFRGVLSEAKLLIGHNVKFDLNWLLECGFEYSGALYDTMVAEYILSCGQKWGLSLEIMSKRYGGTEKKKDLTRDYMREGYTFKEIPWGVVEEYGIADVDATYDIAVKQLEKFEITFEDLYDRM